MEAQEEEVKSVAVFGVLCLEEGRTSPEWEAEASLVGADRAERCEVGAGAAGEG